MSLVLVISIVTFLVKTRGARGMMMPSTPGGRPQGQSPSGQSGLMRDFNTARDILSDGGYICRLKHSGSY